MQVPRCIHLPSRRVAEPETESALALPDVPSVYLIPGAACCCLYMLVRYDLTSGLQHSSLKICWEGLWCGILVS